MKILVIADEHGKTEVTDEIIKNGNFDELIHLGDSLNNIEWLKSNFDYYVVGNNDLKADRNFKAPISHLIEIAGVSFYIEHGTGLNVNDFDASKLILKSHDADVFLFAHTHVKHEENFEGKLIVNPGSIGIPRDDKTGSYFVIEVDNGKIIKYSFEFVL